MTGARAWVQLSTPMRFTRISGSHDPGSVCRKKSGLSKPALFTRQSMPPKRSTAPSRAPPTEPVSPTSHSRNDARPPEASISATTAAPRSRSMSVTATVKPSQARRSAIARPRPDAAPVTNATRPSSSRRSLGDPSGDDGTSDMRGLALGATRVVVEAATRLAAQVAGPHHVLQQRRRRVTTLAELLVQGVEDRVRDVEPDDVHQL